MTDKEGKTIEQRVADTLLDRPDHVAIGGVDYEMPPLTLATLVLVSEAISKLPRVERPQGSQQIVASVLGNARHFGGLADVAAILVLGAKRLTERRKTSAHKLGPFEWGGREEVIDRRARLAKTIAEECRPSDIFDIVVRRLQDAEVGSFFAITTSLSEANILAPTKEVDAPQGTTAPGRP